MERYSQIVVNWKLKDLLSGEQCFQSEIVSVKSRYTRLSEYQQCYTNLVIRETFAQVSAKIKEYKSDPKCKTPLQTKITIQQKESINSALTCLKFKETSTPTSSIRVQGTHVSQQLPSNIGALSSIVGLQFDQHGFEQGDLLLLLPVAKLDDIQWNDIHNQDNVRHYLAVVSSVNVHKSKNMAINRTTVMAGNTKGIYSHQQQSMTALRLCNISARIKQVQAIARLNVAPVSFLRSLLLAQVSDVQTQHYAQVIQNQLSSAVCDRLKNRLDSQQYASVQQFLSSQQSITLISGAAGTGKTTTLAAMVAALTSQNYTIASSSKLSAGDWGDVGLPRKRVLVCASVAGADVLTQKLEAMGGYTIDAEKRPLMMLRAGQVTTSSLVGRPYLLNNIVVKHNPQQAITEENGIIIYNHYVKLQKQLQRCYTELKQLKDKQARATLARPRLSVVHQRGTQSCHLPHSITSLRHSFCESDTDSKELQQLDPIPNVEPNQPRFIARLFSGMTRGLGLTSHKNAWSMNKIQSFGGAKTGDVIEERGLRVEVGTEHDPSSSSTPLYAVQQNAQDDALTTSSSVNETNYSDLEDDDFDFFLPMPPVRFDGQCSSDVSETCFTAFSASECLQDVDCLDCDLLAAQIKDTQNNCDSLKAQVCECEMELLQQEMDSGLKRFIGQRAEVLVSTFDELASDLFHLLPSLKFDHLIVDDAHTSTEPHTLLPLKYLKPTATICLLGDPKQLPPTVHSLDALDHGLNTSLFTRLLHSHDNFPTLTFNTQHRMQSSIARFPNTLYYGGAVQQGGGEVDSAWLQGKPWCQRLVLWDVVQGNMVPLVGRNGAIMSYYNQTEIDMVVEIVRALRDQCTSSVNKTIAILSPYYAQADKLAEALSSVLSLEQVQGKVSHELVDRQTGVALSVATMHNYQGREADIAIISTVMVNTRALMEPYPAIQTTEQARTLGLLSDPQLLNVAVSRGREAVWVVGHSGSLKSSGVWCPLLDYMQSYGTVQRVETVGEHLFQEVKEVGDGLQGSGGSDVAVRAVRPRAMRRKSFIQPQTQRRISV